MLYKAKKTIIAIKKLIRARKVWVKPESAEILLYDNVGRDYLSKLLSDWSVNVLHTRNEVLNFRVLLKCIFHKGNLKRNYINTYIKIVKPKLIITFIDNNIDFLTISERNPSVKTLFIQNGWRGYYADIFESLDKQDEGAIRQNKVDYMATFGDVASIKYKEYIRGKTVSVGSVKNNSYPRELTSNNDRLAFISQWHNDGLWMNGKFYSHDKFFYQPDCLVLKILKDYALHNKKELIIIPRYPAGTVIREEEESYYNNILSEDVKFTATDDAYSSYKAIDQSEVTVSIDSTLGYEALSRGAKTAILTVRGEMLDLPAFTFGWPGKYSDIGPYWINYPDKQEIIKILDFLFEVNEKQWRDILNKTEYSKLLLNDPGNLELKKLLGQALNQASHQ